MWRTTGKRSRECSGAARPDTPYRYLENIAIADVAFEAWGATPEETFVSAGDATMNVMVDALETIAPLEVRRIALSSGALDLLLFELLQELIYYKDAEQLLLRLHSLRIEDMGGSYRLLAEARGEKIDRDRHPLNVDVKAVTLHRFAVERTATGWRASVILDI
ncbi:MAG: archease [Deltaproteobacteria bacterium]|nr:archease [Deltaproteobacteria bacterium]